jgi:excisionase family DNA binding protein
MLGDREFTTEEIAQICGVSRPAVVDWITRGTLRARLTEGGHRRVTRVVLSEFLKGQEYQIPVEVSRERPLIFVLDDEYIWRSSIEESLLRIDAFDVETFAPGMEVLLAVGERKPDLVIFDMHMPGMDSAQLLTALTTSKTELGETLLVAMGIHEEELPLARKNGAHMAIIKSRIASGDLLSLIVKIISDKQRRPLLTS